MTENYTQKINLIKIFVEEAGFFLNTIDALYYIKDFELYTISIPEHNTPHPVGYIIFSIHIEYLRH